MGRATQGVRLINLEKKNDEIASVCKVDTEPETTDEESVRDAFNENIPENSELPENSENTENTENSENQQNENE
jgi:DNA gyrase subunit A